MRNFQRGMDLDSIEFLKLSPKINEAQTTTNLSDFRAEPAKTQHAKATVRNIKTDSNISSRCYQDYCILSTNLVRHDTLIINILVYLHTSSLFTPISSTRLVANYGASYLAVIADVVPRRYFTNFELSL